MKSLKYFLPIICVIITIIFIECKSSEVAESADVNQAQIYQSYTTTYNEEDNTVSTKAVFRFGGSNGTTLVLTDPSNITINGDEMKGGEEFLQGYLYRFNNFKKNTSEFEFSFTDTEKKKYNNTIKIEPIKFTNLTDSISKSRETVISWDGSPIQSNETLTLHIKSGGTSEITITSDIKGANSITVDTSSISELKIGLANIQIVRKISMNLEESGEIGGTISSNYYSNVTPIQIGE